MPASKGYNSDAAFDVSPKASTSKHNNAGKLFKVILSLLLIKIIFQYIINSDQMFPDEHLLSRNLLLAMNKCEVTRNYVNKFTANLKQSIKKVFGTELQAEVLGQLPQNLVKNLERTLAVQREVINSLSPVSDDNISRIPNIRTIQIKNENNPE